MSEDGLPAAHVKRLVKSKLAELMSGLGPDAKGNTHEGHVQKEALNAFGESAKIFIHYLTATANEFCREGKRQTIGVDDVFRAIEDLEFGEFTEPLKQALEGYKKDAAAKTAKRNERESKKRKAAEAAAGDEGEENDAGASHGGAEDEENEDVDVDDADAAGEEEDA